MDKHCTYPDCKCWFDGPTNVDCWQGLPRKMELERIDPIGHNGNTGEHYGTVQIGRFVYRKGPGHYAEYLHTRTGDWRESANVTNEQLKLTREA